MVVRAKDSKAWNPGKGDGTVVAEPGHSLDVGNDDATGVDSADGLESKGEL